AGADTINAGPGNDTLLGGEGPDKLAGNNGDDLIDGDAGNDALFGGMGDDTLNGGAGNDFLISGLGTDSIDGGAGDDVIRAFDFNLNGNVSGDTDTMADVVLGGDGNDTISANDGDTVTGGEGADVINAIGYDQVGKAPVIVTDFNLAEDGLYLQETQGSPAQFAPGDGMFEIRAAANGTDSELVVNGNVVVIVQNTSAADLSADTSWLLNA
ncbi:MAG TPA: calcium-binding protein, partial [Sulfitobacter pontiacus]|nr:calcium-binding protein [Sulfitobacter pontiacus]